MWLERVSGSWSSGWSMMRKIVVYGALASIIPGRETLAWNLSF